MGSGVELLQLSFLEKAFKQLPPFCRLRKWNESIFVSLCLHLLCGNHVPDILSETLHKSTDLFFVTTLEKRHYDHPHFVEKETKAHTPVPAFQIVGAFC